ncbi:uncharacterized protein [Antedon mediterranea]|uniref:uncharacterized protein n=1 Tax=Antedon mediterranea TaxID=105859 RepID=UPI003AF652BE
MERVPTNRGIIVNETFGPVIQGLKPISCFSGKTKAQGDDATKNSINDLAVNPKVERPRHRIKPPVAPKPAKKSVKKMAHSSQGDEIVKEDKFHQIKPPVAPKPAKKSVKKMAHSIQDDDNIVKEDKSHQIKPPVAPKPAKKSVKKMAHSIQDDVNIVNEDKSHQIKPPVAPKPAKKSVNKMAHSTQGDDNIVKEDKSHQIKPPVAPKPSKKSVKKMAHSIQGDGNIVKDDKSHQIKPPVAPKPSKKSVKKMAHSIQGDGNIVKEDKSHQIKPPAAPKPAKKSVKKMAHSIQGDVVNEDKLKKPPKIIGWAKLLGNTKTRGASVKNMTQNFMQDNNRQASHVQGIPVPRKSTRNMIDSFVEKKVEYMLNKSKPSLAGDESDDEDEIFYDALSGTYYNQSSVKKMAHSNQGDDNIVKEDKFHQIKPPVAPKPAKKNEKKMAHSIQGDGNIVKEDKLKKPPKIIGWAKLLGNTETSGASVKNMTQNFMQDNNGLDYWSDDEDEIFYDALSDLNDIIDEPQCISGSEDIKNHVQDVESIRKVSDLDVSTKAAAAAIIEVFDNNMLLDDSTQDAVAVTTKVKDYIGDVVPNSLAIINRDKVSEVVPKDFVISENITTSNDITNGIDKNAVNEYISSIISTSMKTVDVTNTLIDNTISEIDIDDTLSKIDDPLSDAIINHTVSNAKIDNTVSDIKIDDTLSDGKIDNTILDVEIDDTIPDVEVDINAVRQYVSANAVPTCKQSEDNLAGDVPANQNSTDVPRAGIFRRLFRRLRRGIRNIGRHRTTLTEEIQDTTGEEIDSTDPSANDACTNDASANDASANDVTDLAANDDLVHNTSRHRFLSALLCCKH